MESLIERLAREEGVDEAPLNARVLANKVAFRAMYNGWEVWRRHRGKWIHWATTARGYISGILYQYLPGWTVAQIETEIKEYADSLQ